jgi:hypothetical protein
MRFAGSSVSLSSLDGFASGVRAVRSAGALAIAAAALCGCSTILHKFHHDDASIERAEQLQILQFKVMRFADEYVGGIIEPLQRFQATTDNPADRLAAQNWKLSQATAAYTIATGPSAVGNAIDMFVLATLSRMVVEDAWVTDRFGKRAVPLQDAQRRLEVQARDLARGAVTAQQFDQVERVIAEWRKQNPHILAVTYVHFRDFADSIQHPTSNEALSAGGLFAILGIDPLSNLDPAVRELAQTRQLAERTIYYAQRVPSLVDMQVELLTDQFATTPETIRLLANIDRATLAAESTGRLAAELPGVLASEREAAIRQFMDAVTVGTARTRELIVELHGALDAGTATSNSLNTTIRSFEQLMAAFEKPTPVGGPPAAPGKPFDITEYTAAAGEVTRAASELKQLLAGIEREEPALAEVSGRAAASLQQVIDHAYWRMAELLGLLLLGGLAAALAYRGLVRRPFA